MREQKHERGPGGRTGPHLTRSVTARCPAGLAFSGEAGLILRKSPYILGAVSSPRNLAAKISILALAVVWLSAHSFGQDVERPFLKYMSWALFQAIPSPVVYDDSGGSECTVKAGLRWQIIPVNYSFSANRFVSNAQFFMINPVRRFAGSLELFLQPEVVLTDFDHSRLKRFWVSAGFRVIIPMVNYGELLSGSLGVKANLHGAQQGGAENFFGLEAGFYLYGMLGVQANLNFHSGNRFSLGLYLKYY